ncbi:MAG: hypothetical protein R3E08_01195 [Thiotrichaceae bacterium]
MEHAFTPQILQILQDFFGEDGEIIFERSLLLQYLNIKTRSASSGSKSRGSLAISTLFMYLWKNYLKHDFDKQGNYSEYEGARFTDLQERQRQLPFSRLQNHPFKQSHE